MSPVAYPPAQWRLLLTPSASGAWNMAVDEVILEAVGKGISLPTLRLYGWDPPCLSLGYAQPSADVNRTRLTQLGWEIVRRITGGRAILHTDELTYAVIAPYDEPRVIGNLLESYRRISEALLSALTHLNLPVQAFPLQASGQKNAPKPVCFEVPSNYEITVGGKKIVGSAQARKKPGILQHGTLPLYGDLTRITQVLNTPEGSTQAKARERLLAHATTVEAVLGSRISWMVAAQAFIWGFSESLQIEFVESALTEAELEQVEILGKEKYAHPDWIARI